MKTKLILTTLLTGAFCLVMCSSGPSAPADLSSSAPWPDQLVGKWEGAIGGARYVEHWNKVDANTYEGSAVTYDGDKAVSSESMRITLFSDHWLYLANPGGQGVSCFVRCSADTTTWIFENKEHDFPKRVGYRITGDALTAWIAGKDDADNRMEFPLKRAK